MTGAAANGGTNDRRDGRTEVPKGIVRAEQETVVRWDEGERVVTIWSASPTVLRKLHRMGLLPASESRQEDGALHGREYRVPLQSFRWGLKRRRSKPLVLAENTPRGTQSEVGNSGSAGQTSEGQL